MPQLLRAELLPERFEYPAVFRRIVDLELTNLEPWWILDEDLLIKRYEGLRSRYPQRKYVPFAIRGDRDDVACWDASRPGVVFVVHDYGQQGHEVRETYEGFEAWFRSAIDDMLAFAQGYDRAH